MNFFFLLTLAASKWSRRFWGFLFLVGLVLYFYAR